MRYAKRGRRAIDVWKREELLVDKRFGVKVSIFGDRVADELARGVIQTQLAHEASHAILTTSKTVFGMWNAVDR